MNKPTPGRKCLFCPSPAKSREHIFAEWLTKRMGIRELNFGFATTHESKGRKTHPMQTPYYHKTKQVCVPCNTNWMRKLEQRFELHVGHLIEPTWPINAHDMISNLRVERNSITQWMLKTAILIEQASPTFDRPVIPFAVREMAKTGLITDDFSLALTEIKTREFDHRLMKGLPVWRAGNKTNQEHIDGFQFAVCLNHLAMWIIKSPDASIGLCVHNRNDLLIAPYFITPEIRYTMPVEYAFATFDSFLDAIEIYPR